MDALRSCYKTWMRFPGVGLVKVRWYWTDKPPLDRTHVFGSHNHSREEGWDDADTGEPGEVWSFPREYDKGAPPGLSPCSGPRGSDTAWEGLTDVSSPRFTAGDAEGANATAVGYSAVATVVRLPVRAFPGLVSSGDMVGSVPSAGDSLLVSAGEASSDPNHVGLREAEGAADLVDADDLEDVHDLEGSGFADGNG